MGNLLTGSILIILLISKIAAFFPKRSPGQ